MDKRHNKKGRARTLVRPSKGKANTSNKRTAHRTPKIEDHQHDAVDASADEEQPGETKLTTITLPVFAFRILFADVNSNQAFNQQVMALAVSNSCAPLMAQFKVDFNDSKTAMTSLRQMLQTPPTPGDDWPNVDRKAIVNFCLKVQPCLFRSPSNEGKPQEAEAGRKLVMWAHHLYQKNRQGFFQKLPISKEQCDRGGYHKHFAMTKEEALVFCARFLLTASRYLSSGDAGFFGTLLNSSLKEPAQQMARNELKATVVIKCTDSSSVLTPSAHWQEMETINDIPSWLADMEGITSALAKSEQPWYSFDDAEQRLYAAEFNTQVKTHLSQGADIFSFGAIAALLPRRSRQDCVDYYLHHAALFDAAYYTAAERIMMPQTRRDRRSKFPEATTSPTTTHRATESKVSTRSSGAMSPPRAAVSPRMVYKSMATVWKTCIWLCRLSKREHPKQRAVYKLPTSKSKR